MVQVPTEQTQRYLRDVLAFNWNTTEDLNNQARLTGNRMLHGLLHLVTAMYDANATVKGMDETGRPPRDDSDPVTAARSPITRYSMGAGTLKRAAVPERVPGFMGRLWRSLSAAKTAVYEVMSGAAYDSAYNGTPNATAFHWHLTAPPVPGQESLWARAWRGTTAVTTGFFFSGVAERLSRVAHMTWELDRLNTDKVERARRVSVALGAVKNTFRAIVAQPVVGVSSAPMVRPSFSDTFRVFFAANATTIPDSFCFNVTTLDFCHKCFWANQELGYLERGGRQAVWYYNNTGNQQQNTIAAAFANWNFTNSYWNVTNLALVPAFVGGSASNPPWLWDINVSVWSQFDDIVPNKTPFTRWELLINTTWNFIVDAISNASNTVPGWFDLASVETPAAAGKKRGLAASSPACVHAGAHGCPSDIAEASTTDALIIRPLASVLRFVGVERIARRLSVAAQSFRVASPANGTGPYTSWKDILEGWGNLVWDEFIYCNQDEELTALNVRYSLLQGAIIAIIPALLLSEFVAAIPTVFAPVLSLVFYPFLLIGPIVGVLFWIGLCTGWKVLCLPTLPSILFSSMLMSLLGRSVVFNKCPIAGGGLVVQTTYSSSNCMVCDNWLNGVFTIASCRDDLGWVSPFDVPVFLLKAYAPGVLAFIADPGNFPYPFSVLIAAPTIQGWLHRWDAVNLSDPYVYRQQYACAFWMLVPWIILMALLGYLLSFGPIWQAVLWLFDLLSVLLTSMFFFIAAFFVVVYAMFVAPVVMARVIVKAAGERAYEEAVLRQQQRRRL